MSIRLIQFLAVFSVALALVPSGAHLLELPNKMRMRADAYRTVQSLYRGWAFVGFVVIAALLFTLLLALIERGTSAFPACLIAVLCVLATQVIFWPLSADDWDSQMLFFLANGFRVIAHDRRGHGRSTQTATGHEMDAYAADVAALTDMLDLKGAFHVGHSTGGGEVAHYVARARPGRVSKAVLVSAVPPIMVKSDKNPGGLPIEVFDGLRTALAANRAQFYIDIPTGPFYGFNRPGAKISQGLIDNWWRQGMIGAANAHYECIKAFSETDFNDDLKKIDVPVLVAHGTDDQIVPYADSAPLSVKLLKNGTLKTYEGLPHGMLSTHPQILNPDILAFLKA